MLPPDNETSSTVVIVLLGGPGSGKGTHGQALADALAFKHISSGEHLRDHIRRETPLGLQARSFIENGQLVPDKLATEMIKELLGECNSKTGFVLDGYPRSLAQAEDLDRIGSKLRCPVTQAFYLAVSDEEIVRRLSGRLTCRVCGKTWHESSNPPARPGLCDNCGGELFRRIDDEPATIRRRIAVFHEMIHPLLSFFRESGRLTEIAAEGAVRDVSARVIETARREISR
jgi:adenylate kinase